MSPPRPSSQEHPIELDQSSRDYAIVVIRMAYLAIEYPFDGLLSPTPSSHCLDMGRALKEAYIERFSVEQDVLSASKTVKVSASPILQL